MESKGRISRRKFLLLAGGAAGATALASCAQPTAEVVEVEVTREVEVPGPEEIDITVVIYGNVLTEADDIANSKIFTVHLADYNLADRGAKTRYEPWVGWPRDEYWTKIRLMTASAELDDHLLWGGYTPLGFLVEEGALMPIDDLMDAAGISIDEWIEPSHTTFRYSLETKKPGDGPVWGLPNWVHGGMSFLIYNEDMLKAAGAPLPKDGDTYADIVEIAKMVANADEGIFGLAFQSYNGVHGLDWDNSFVSPFGGWLIDESGTKCLMNSPECVEAYQFYYDLIHTLKVSPTPAEVEAYGHYNEGASNNKLAMYRLGIWGANWYMPPMRPENADPTMGTVSAPDRYDASTTDGRRGNILTNDYFGIAVNTKHPAEALDVLYWLTNTEAGKFHVDVGVSSVAPRPEVLEYAQQSDNIKAAWVAATLLDVDPMPFVANGRSGEVNDLFNQILFPIDAGDEYPDQAYMDDVAAQVQAILDQPPA